MREIKFRVWDKENGNWLHESSVRISGDGKMWFNSIVSPSIMTDEQVIICESTGLKDKTGKEIYEGDILQARNGIEMDLGVFQVVWSERGWYFQKEPNKWEYMSAEYVEVIGNIYSNPELLK